MKQAFLCYNGDNKRKGGPQVNISYQKQLDIIIYSEREKARRPSLLLHSCCAPCSSYVLEYLTAFFDVTVYFFNPNIHPEEEYRRRIEEQKNLIASMKLAGPVGFIEGPYDAPGYFAMVKGLEEEPEGGRRCILCYKLRLDSTARLAWERGFDYFTTTLTISPIKNALVLNEIGSELGLRYGVQYLYSDFKKKGGFQRSVELSRLYGLYRQDYCGCLFSRRMRRKLDMN